MSSVHLLLKVLNFHVDRHNNSAQRAYWF